MSKIITSLVFAAASVACTSTGAMELLTNAILDAANAPPGWTLDETGGIPPTPREAATQNGEFANQDEGGLGLWLEAFQGSFFGNGAEPVSAVLRQTVPFTGTTGENYTFSGYSRFESGYSGGVDTLDPGAPGGEMPSPTESTFELAFLNAGGTVVGSVVRDLRTEQVNGGDWLQHTLIGPAPAETASVRVTASAIDMVPNVGPDERRSTTPSRSAAQSAPTTEILANADLNVAPDPVAPGWDASGPYSHEGFSAHAGFTGYFLRTFEANPDPLDATLLQTVPATPGTTYQFKGWSLFFEGYSGGVEILDPSSPLGEVPSPTETFFVMEFLNGVGTQIGSETLDLRDVQMNDSTFREHTLTGLAPDGTTQVRVGLRVDDLIDNFVPGQDFATANFDDFSLIAVLAGDYNENGIVDAADYTVWRDHQGQNFTLTNENPTAATPGVVDAEDYAFWKSQFGAAAGSGASSLASVPEPATLLLILIGMLAIPSRRRAARA